MNYLYHMIPEKIVGKELVPLSQLKKIDKKAYEIEMEKYKGREQVMEKQIYPLDCLWNDALHLSPIHPSKIKKALKDSGNKTKPEWKFFKINPNLLDKENATVYLFPKNKNKKPLEGDFINFDPKDFSKYNKIPKTTIEYYKDEKANGRKPLSFMFIPHILYKGKLNVKDLELIKV